MADFQLKQGTSQKLSQVQTQKMSQVQIMSLNLLAMSSFDLRNEIYSQVEKNPALEIVKDQFESGEKSVRERTVFSDNIRLGSVNSARQKQSDDFQSALESNADYRVPLGSHLEHQLNAMNLSEKQHDFCVKLIQNLNENGFHILSPYSLLDRSDPEQNEAFLNSSLDIVRRLDPIGCCVKDSMESLLVQAQILGDASEIVLFFLDGHLDFLDPPKTEKVQKKLRLFFKKQEQEKLMFGANLHEFALCEEDFTPEEIEDALSYIRKLDPYPARNFGTAQTVFVAPDVHVEKILEDGKISFKVTMSREYLPEIAISEEYKKILENSKAVPNDGSESSERKKSEYRFVKDSVGSASVFIESILFRESTLLKACMEIVEVQKKFFETGTDGEIVPLRQKDVAEKIGVHETTVSRMANKKYISCEWGIFPISFFFSTGVLKTTALVTEKNDEPSLKAETGGAAGAVSKEAVKFEIKQILEAHKSDKKSLSDQKISDALAQKGIKVARRTVAKYRSELNIDSSYNR